LNSASKDKLSAAIELTHHISFEKGQKLGLGWHQDNAGNRSYLWHNGGTYGSSSFVAFIPGTKIAVVILSNDAASVDDLARSIIRVL